MAKLNLFSTAYERRLVSRWSRKKAASFELEAHCESLRDNNMKLLFAGLFASIVASFGLLGSKSALTAQFGILAVAAPFVYANERKRMTLQPAVQLYRAKEALQTSQEDLKMMSVVSGIHRQSSRAEHIQVLKKRIETASEAFRAADQACRTPQKNLYTSFLNLKQRPISSPFKVA